MKRIVSGDDETSLMVTCKLVNKLRLAPTEQKPKPHQNPSNVTLLPVTIAVLLGIIA